MTRSLTQHVGRSCPASSPSRFGNSGLLLEYFRLALFSLMDEIAMSSRCRVLPLEAGPSDDATRRRSSRDIQVKRQLEGPLRLVDCLFEACALMRSYLLVGLLYYRYVHLDGQVQPTDHQGVTCSARMALAVQNPTHLISVTQICCRNACPLSAVVETLEAINYLSLPLLPATPAPYFPSTSRPRPHRPAAAYIADLLLLSLPASLTRHLDCIFVWFHRLTYN